ncbi:hypothetical protein [Anabaena sp. UHCC 0204]|uniref:hypothetical protein n=1 Tax=Anabaena sp. UHCC 0204 TaxID=2590009 RepID=UPI0020C259C3|nr:hypothetical protein [Anabaena sp. UHCC 0204]
MMKIVFNSSPLIFLSRLNFRDLFLTTESQFLLPESVNEEISAKQDQSSWQNLISDELETLADD